MTDYAMIGASRFDSHVTARPSERMGLPECFNDRDSPFVGIPQTRALPSKNFADIVPLSSRNVCGKPRPLSEMKTSGAHGRRRSGNTSGIHDDR
jgi:hypothetical protein